MLQSQGRMKEAGLQAYSQRRAEKSRIYSYEQKAGATLEPADEALFRKNKRAWKFFEAQPAGYRHLAIWRVVSAKRAETRQARLVKLIEASQNAQRL
jgi:hypothetical protein